jgi:hypothetical protein
MANQAGILQAVRDRFDTLVATPNTLQTIHDNEQDTGTREQERCRFTVRVDGNDQVAMGVARYRTTGVAMAYLTTPSAKTDGDARMMVLADLVVTAFRGAKIASPDITFTPAPGVVGLAEQDEALCKRTVRIPFRADEV